MKENCKYDIESEFLKKEKELLSCINVKDTKLSPDFFEKNETLVDEILYVNTTYLSKLNLNDITETIIKVKEGYYLFFYRKTNENSYSLKVFFTKEKKYSDIIFYINRLNKL